MDCHDSHDLSGLQKAVSDVCTDTEYEKALSSSRLASTTCPVDSELYLSHAKFFSKLGKFDEAVHYADLTINLCPSLTEGYLTKADALQKCGKFSEATVTYCQGLTVSHNHSELLSALINCITKSQNDLSDTICNIIKSPETSDSRYQTFIIVSLIGQKFLDQSLVNEAITILNAAMKIDCNCSRVKCATVAALSDAYYKNGNYRKTVENLELQLELLSKSDDDVTRIVVHEETAKLMLCNNEVFCAVRHLNEAIRLRIEKTMNVDESCVMLADALVQLGDYDEARLLLGKYCIKTPNALLLLAKISVLKNDIETALGYCNELLKRLRTTDERAPAVILKCKCYLMQNNANAAIMLLDRTAKRCSCESPSSFTTGLYFGILSECHLAVNEYKNARHWAKAQLKIAIKLKSQSLEAEALRHLADVYQAVKDYPNALVLLQRCDKLIEDEKVDTKIISKLNLAKLYGNYGKLEDAEEYLKERLRLAEKTGYVPLQIDAHSDLTRFYRINKNLEKQAEHFAIEEELSKQCGSERKNIIVLEDRADYEADREAYDEAIASYEQCLMLSQEQENLIQEAKICAKLGSLHTQLSEQAEALRYYQQALVVYQQLSNVESMMEIYAKIAELHSQANSVALYLATLRYYATLAGFLGDSFAKLDALIKIGKTLLNLNEFSKARKVFLKALAIAKEKNCGRELALLYGHIAHCCIKMGKPHKALLHFCQQLPYLNEINDVQGQCDALRHLIEEKCANNDANWALRLCNSRVTISRRGSEQLQLAVLKDAANTALQLLRNDDAQRFLEKALLLSNELQYADSRGILQHLAEVYRKCGLNDKAIFVLSTYQKFCSDQATECDCMLLISQFWLFKGEVIIAKKYLDAVYTVLYPQRSHNDYQLLWQQCAYERSAYYYLVDDFEKSLLNLEEVKVSVSNLVSSGCINKLSDQKTFLQNLEIQKSVVEWCTKSDDSFTLVNMLLTHTDKADIYQVLDATCLYGLITDSFHELDGIAKIHWYLANNDFTNALALTEAIGQTPKDLKQSDGAVILDKAICLFFLSRYEECFQYINKIYNGSSSIILSSCDWNKSLSLFSISYEEELICSLLYLIKILCSAILFNDPVQSLLVAEEHFWKTYHLSQAFNSVQRNLEKLKQKLYHLDKSALYHFQAGNFSVFWKITENGVVETFIRRSSAPLVKLPNLYSRLFDKMFSGSSIKQAVCSETLLTGSQLLLHVNQFGFDYTHAVTLFDTDTTFCQQATNPLLICGFKNDDSFQSFNSKYFVNEDDLLESLKVASIIVLNCSCIFINITHIETIHLSTDVAILLNCESERYTTGLLVAGVGCVISLQDTAPKVLARFVEDLLERHTLIDSLQLLSHEKVKIYGNRYRRITVFEETDEKSVCDKDEKLSLNCEKQIPTKSRSKDEAINLDTIEVSSAKEVDVQELMKSFKIRKHEIRRRRKRRESFRRSYLSEGEVSGSCRSSLSEANTDTEAVVVDIYLESS